SHGVEAVYVAGRIVDSIIVFNCVWTAVRQSEEGVAAGVGNRRTESAEKVGGSAVFQFVVEAREISEISSTGFVESAYGEQTELRVRTWYREKCKQHGQ